MRLGIRYRLLLPLGLLLVGVVAASLWSARVAARRAEERVAGQLGNVSDLLRRAPYPLTGWVLDQMKVLSGADFLVVHPDGSRLTTFPSGSVESPADHLLAAPEEGGLGPPVEVNGGRYRCRRLGLTDGPNAGKVVYTFYPETLLDEAIADAVRPSLLGLLFGLAAVGLTFAIGQRLVGRIRALERRTRQIAAGDFSPMPVPRADDEVRDLAASVNEMAARLARLQQAVQTTERVRLTGQLAGGLAHQLRNSATGARLALQVFLDEHPGRHHEALSVALRQLTLMEANLRRFIDLGRPGDGERRACSLASTLADVVALHHPRCKHGGVELLWGPPAEDVVVEGDPGQLGDLFANLLGNAVDAVGVGGVVGISLRREGAVAVIEVADSGPGPPPEVAGRLFEPFVTGKPEGIGLGLAVARHAAEAHGGAVTWRREAGRTVFRVELPVRVSPGVDTGNPAAGAG